MSTLASPTAARMVRSRWARLPLPLPVAVVASRLVVLAGGTVGETLTQRVPRWQLVDPEHLTLKLGALGNVLAAAAVRWDSLHYLAIAEHGYNTPSNTVFFPLYPLLIRALAWLTRSDVIAGVCISGVAFGVALLLLHQLVKAEMGNRVADATVLLLAFSPLSLFFTAVYTESLFLALCLGAFLLARRGHLGWASAAAAGAALTHVEGALLVVPLTIISWEGQGELRARDLAARVRRVAVRAAPPLLPLAGFLVYLHDRGYGWLAPSSDEVYYGHHFTGPVTGVAQGVVAGVSGLWRIVGGTISGSAGGLVARQDAFENVLYLIVLVIAIATCVMAWRRLPRAYAVYCVLFLLVCVSSPVSGGVPLTSLDRYVLVLFPLWIVAAQWLQERRLLRPALAGSAMLMFVFALQFARWAFIG